MTKNQASDVEQQQRKDAKEKEQDIKNAEYLARVGQPNHPNT